MFFLKWMFVSFVVWVVLVLAIFYRANGAGEEIGEGSVVGILLLFPTIALLLLPVALLLF